MNDCQFIKLSPTTINNLRELGKPQSIQQSLVYLPSFIQFSPVKLLHYTVLGLSYKIQAASLACYICTYASTQTG